MAEQFTNLKTKRPKPAKPLTIQDNKSTPRLIYVLFGFVNSIEAGQNAIDAKGSPNADLDDKILRPELKPKNFKSNR